MWCIVNVAVGPPYVDYQNRLAASIKATSWAGGVLLFTNAYPPNSPTHYEVPYGFKLFAIMEARRRGADQILYVDSPVQFRRNPLELTKELADTGVFFSSHGEPLRKWCSDDVLSYYGIARDDLGQFPLIEGQVYGFDFRFAAVAGLFSSWVEGLKAGLFTDVKKPQVSSDPSVEGHRHDEAVLSCIAYKGGFSKDYKRQTLSVYQTGIGTLVNAGLGELLSTWKDMP